MSAHGVGELACRKIPSFVKQKHTIGLWPLFWSFAKMGAVLIGGGYALLPLLEREVVTRRNWAKSEDMIDLYALAQVLPGVIAVNTAMLVGNRLRGLPGTLVAAFGLTAAPFLMIAAYAAAYGTLRDTSLFPRALSGVQPAVAGMMLGLGVDMVRKLKPKPGCKQPGAMQSGTSPLQSGEDTVPRRFRRGGHIPILLASAAAVAMLLFNPSFGWLVLFSIVVGLAYHACKIRKAAKC